MKFVKHILLFIFCFLAFYYLVFYILFNITIQNKLLIHHFDKKIPVNKSIFYKTINEFPSDTVFDYLFLGSSHCYRGLDPVMFKSKGISAYNLGSSSQTPANAVPLLNKYIKNTKAVILEVYPVVFGIEPTEAYYDALTASNNFMVLWQNAICVESFKAFNLLMLKPFINNELKKDTLKKCLFHSGFTTVNDSAINRKVGYKPITLNKKWLEKQFNYLKEIKSICDKHQIKLILVYAPVPKKLKIINESVYYTNLYLFLKQNPDIKFYNYGRKHTLNDGLHFYDDDHLNASGVKLFNEFFIKDLVNKGR